MGQIDNLEINPHTYGQLIFYKGKKNIKWQKVSSANVAGKVGQLHVNQWNLEHTLIPYTKINSKWLKYLNISHDTIKVLEENITKTFSNRNHTNAFLYPSPKAKEIKPKLNKWDLIKCTSFCIAKKTLKMWKYNVWQGRKYL